MHLSAKAFVEAALASMWKILPTCEKSISISIQEQLLTGELRNFFEEVGACFPYAFVDDCHSEVLMGKTISDFCKLSLGLAAQSKSVEMLLYIYIDDRAIFPNDISGLHTIPVDTIFIDKFTLQDTIHRTLCLDLKATNIFHLILGLQRLRKEGMKVDPNLLEQMLESVSLLDIQN